MNKVDEWLALLIPRRCVLCNEESGTLSICPGCSADLPWLEAGAYGGAPRAPGQLTDSADASARRQSDPAHPDRVVVALAYEFPVDRLVTGAKFHGQLHFARALGEMLARVLAGDRPPEELPDLLIPVPLHRQRLVERGYNQALEIARPVAGRLGLELAPGACQRLRPTAEQTGLSAAGRRRNLRGAFQANSLCSGRRVAVLDDVITTGSTVAAMVAAVRQAGALTVEAWGAARTL